MATTKIRTNVEIDAVIAVVVADVSLRTVEKVASGAITPLALSHVESSRWNGSDDRGFVRLHFTALNDREGKRTVTVATNAVRTLVARIVTTTVNGD